MSSLVETSSKEESTPVSGVQTIAGHNFNPHSLPKRTWNGYGLVSYSHRKGDPPKKSSSDRNSDIAQNREELQEELISMLTASEEALENKDTIAKIDNLIALMKAHKLSDDPIPSNTAVSSCSSSSSSSSSSFDFNFEKYDGFPQIPLDKTVNKPIPLTDFQFSFASNIPPNRTRTYTRRHRARRSLEYTPHPLSQTTYPEARHDDDDDDDYESDIDIIEAQLLRSSSPSQHEHILHRKILPLPKPRWMRKQQQQQEQPSKYAESPYMWPFSPPMIESQRKYTPTFDNDADILLEHEIHNVGDPVDASYRDNPKKIKRSGTDGNEEERKGLRRKDRRWKSAPDKGKTTSSGSQFPASTFDFTMDAQTRDRLKQLPKLEDLPRSSESSLGLTNVLRRTLSQKVNRIEPNSRPKQKIPAPPVATPAAPPPLPRQADKKKVKPPATEKKKSTPKRGKKPQRKKKAEDEPGSGPSTVFNSDVSVARSADPDEWICVFCQYEIFCHGLEVARRKGGYYRRRRERQRRLREMEARRAGECISGPASDVDEADDIPQQQFIVPPGSGGPGGTGPPPGLVDHRRRGRESRAA
ncbi:hypothetical protein BJV82DRAFT_601576 [Fennellomyces sp. T-0311]|nr:hypothetical protein BJV82DRAFT_601576 [Fennellomyces sp. T-0311]